MDFFDHQQLAAVRSRRIFLLLFIFLPVVIGLLYFVCLFCFGAGVFLFALWGSLLQELETEPEAAPVDAFIALWQPELLLIVALSVSLFILLAIRKKLGQLRSGGGRAVTESLGGRWIPGTSQRRNERRLLNIVEEIAIASGVPVPDVYILDNETGINALVAANTIDDAAIAVTHGALQALDRDELQGMVAHEFSHLLRGDTLLNMRLTGLVHGLFYITLLADRLMTNKRDYELFGDGIGFGLGTIKNIFFSGFGFLLAFIGFNSSFLGRVVQAAVSRQREYLADAAAVQFTRYPAGLMSAFEKIQDWPGGSEVRHRSSEEVSHACFANCGATSNWLTSTHPKLNQRLNRLKAMTGVHLFDTGRAKPSTAEEKVPRRKSGFFSGPDSVEDALRAPVNPTAAALLSSIGAMDSSQLRQAQSFLEEMPEALRTTAREPEGAAALMCAILLADDPAVRSKQISIVENHLQGAGLSAFQTLLSEHPEFRRSVKIPLAELAMPALRHLSDHHYRELRSALAELIQADGRADMFEFALDKMIERHLEAGTGGRSVAIKYHRLGQLKAAASLLLSAAAHAGSQEPAAVSTAFERGAQMLGVSPGPLSTGEAVDLAGIDRALDQWAQAAPRLKKQLVIALVEVVQLDGRLTAQEAEFVRAVVECLGCPMPPVGLPVSDDSPPITPAEAPGSLDKASNPTNL